uniref:Hyaluronidase n=1 Tax=Nothoprocta perdicaria TaxID=30464 RepID=A0A8C6YSH5_NOTPE
PIIRLIPVCVAGSKLCPPGLPLPPPPPPPPRSPPARPRSSGCKPRFQVEPDLSLFDVRASPNEGFVDQNLTIFYKERLGLYPYYTAQRAAVNGGVPQNSSLAEHLACLRRGIAKYIPSEAAEGLAVIDWEEWRPIWVRNWKPKDVYRNASQQLVRRRQPAWDAERVYREAVLEFESAAQRFMVKTLRHAKSARPKQLWGFYLFPDCYNHDYSKNKETYTGQCPDVEKTRNDQLAWLWKESLALYPSIYLDPVLASTSNSRKFVRARVMEALRVSQQHHEGYALPVFVYTRPTYTRSMDVLTQRDLISTIGESAALGAAGAIFWGDNSCQAIQSYLEGELGRYIVNVTTAAELCSAALCEGRGRCRRRDSGAAVFLHLPPGSFEGRLSDADADFLRTHFRCHCYRGWRGGDCRLPDGTPGGGAPTAPAPLLLVALLAPLARAL